MDIKLYNFTVNKLNQATKAYDLGKPFLTDEQWDNDYFAIKHFEDTYGYIRPDSPTQKINYEIKNSLTKVEHNHNMLSLDKTKDIKDIKTFANNHTIICMGKMDGLTCSLRYVDGKLVSAETRGNGYIGEDITHNARVISTIPKQISYKDELIVDGEIICKTNDFYHFNSEYKNPRNFAAGSIRLLNSQECQSRNLTFIAWELIKGYDDINSFQKKLDILQDLGFKIVPYTEVFDLEKDIELIKDDCAFYYYPIDGLVFKFDDISYGNSLGTTAHHAKNAIAYKFYDETYPSKLINIEWSMGRTGTLTPIAVFEPIEIDGSTVERASLHNISVMKQTLKHPYIGQDIEVFKANAIIPQIAECVDFDLSSEIQELPIPSICPVCGGATSVDRSYTGVENLICTNPKCDGKIINKFDHFCGKNGLDIKGLSVATLNKLIDWGWITHLYDIFFLEKYKDEWSQKSGFGIKSVENILNAVLKARVTDLPHFISSLGIPMIGLNVAKDICKHVDTYEEFRELIDSKFDFSKWDNFGFEKSNNLLKFNYEEADYIYKFLIIENVKTSSIINNNLDNITIVITGKLNNYKNRGELEDIIRSHGGKIGSSITTKTNYLINNDINSTSSKNKRAKELNIPIITEKEFCEKYLQN